MQTAKGTNQLFFCCVIGVIVGLICHVGDTEWSKCHHRTDRANE